METMLTTELSILVWVTGGTALMWVPYILCRLATYGIIPSLMYRHDDQPLPAWAERAKKAHYNAVENLVPFAVLIIIAHLTGLSTEMTVLGAQVYLAARIVHFFAFVGNIPFGRTITFAIGWFAMAAIFVEIIGA